MKRTLLSAVLFTSLSTGVFAQDNTWQDETKDAWIDGKVEATLLFNGNLNSFDINTDVKMGTVTLTGQVDTSVDRQLAAELAKGIDGVKDVKNELVVVREDVDMDSEESTGFIDTKIATVIKSRYLFNSDISGTSIDVDVDGLEVTLNGEVESEAVRDLAIEIAKNADDVQAVTSNLTVKQKKMTN